MSDVPEVLFVCVHNAGRSQMAAALLDHHAAGRGPRPLRRLRTRPTRSTPRSSRSWPNSASTSPSEFPKPLTTEVVQAADVVITMGCGDACPIFPGKRYLDWELTTPPARTSTTSAPSATTSTSASGTLLAELVPATTT